MFIQPIRLAVDDSQYSDGGRQLRGRFSTELKNHTITIVIQAPAK